VCVTTLSYDETRHSRLATTLSWLVIRLSFSLHTFSSSLCGERKRANLKFTAFSLSLSLPPSHSLSLEPTRMHNCTHASLSPSHSLSRERERALSFSEFVRYICSKGHLKKASRGRKREREREREMVCVCV